MAAKLKLVTTPANRYAPRPIKVHYEGGMIGSCKTVKTALAAATKHLIEDRFKRVVIYSDDLPVASVERVKRTVKLEWSQYALCLVDPADKR